MDWTFLLLAILGLGLLVAFHELGHHLVALWTGMRVRRFSVGFGPAILRKTHKGVDYTIGALPLGGFVDIVGMNPMEDGAYTDPGSYQRRPKWARAAVVAAGPVFNYALAWVLLVGLMAFGGMKQDHQYRVRQVMADTAAEAAGVQEGDIILKVDGQAVNRENPLPAIISENGGKEVELTIRRGGETIAIKATPRGAPGLLGVGLDRLPVGPAENYPIGQAAVLASAQVVDQTVGIVRTIGGWFQGQKVEVGGPKAIVDELQSAAERSFKEFLFFVALLSVMLGFFNLLPIPPLDGSKLTMLGAEIVARRNIPARVQVYVQGVGMVLMLSLLVVVTIKDFQRPRRGADKPPVEQTQDPKAEPKADAPAEGAPAAP